MDFCLRRMVPELFAEVVGHEKVKNVLMTSVAGDRVGHAYIFEGPEGVGRLTTAKAFAKLLLCENPTEKDACNACKSCSMCNSDNHPDVQIITNQLYDPAKKSTDILIDTVRNMKKDVYIKPFSSERKIYIVPKADTMNAPAQNSLLKVLEEPPAYCTIILIAENSNMFLPTILSRAVNVKFFPLQATCVEEYLNRNHPSLGDGVFAIAAMSGGCIGKAKELAESDDVMQIRNELLNNLNGLAGKNSKAAYDLMLFLKHNKENIELIMDMMREYFRDLMYFCQTGSCEKAGNKDRIVELEKTGSRIYSDTPMKLLEILLRYDDYFSKNISYAQIAQCMSLELWEAINDRSYRS